LKDLIYEGKREKGYSMIIVPLLEEQGRLSKKRGK